MIKQASLQEVETVEVKLPGHSSPDGIISFTLQLSLPSVMCVQSLSSRSDKYMASMERLII